jgi:hypothetical protein
MIPLRIVNEEVSAYKIKLEVIVIIISLQLRFIENAYNHRCGLVYGF